MFQGEFTVGAESDLARLDKPVAQRVLKKLRWLADNFEIITPETLTGQWQGVFKLRVGDYRVLYTCNKEKRKIIVHLSGIVVKFTTKALANKRFSATALRFARRCG